MARKHPERDEKTGKFLPAKEAPEEFTIGFDTWNDLIKYKTTMRSVHLLYMKYLRGTVTLDSMQAKALMDLYKILSDKVAPNAKGSYDNGPSEVNVVIRAPKAPTSDNSSKKKKDTK